MTDPDVGGFDLLAASIRRDSSDLRTYLEVVAAKLTDALPGSVRVERDGGLFAREHHVRRVSVQLGDRAYQLEWLGNDVRASIGAAVVPLDQWADDLGQQLSLHARTEAQSRSAMTSLVDGRLPAHAIGRPAAGGIVARVPGDRFSPDSTVEVGAGDAAVLVLGSQVLAPLGPGVHRLGDAVPADAAAAALQDPATAELRGALFFVSTAERPNQRFGGTVDRVLDPATQLAVGLRMFGEYSMRVADPAALVGSLGVQGDVGDERITDLLRDVVLKVLRSDLAAHISAQAWPVLGLAAHMDELEAAALERLREPAAAFGLAVVRFGNFTVTMKEEDEALVTAHHARLASAAVAAPPPAATAPAPPAPAAEGMTCAACGSANAAGAHFCSSCGRPLALRCPGCGADTVPGSRFCGQCGRALAEGAS